MALTVEDGSIVAGADSYVTLAEYQAYGADRGWTLGDDDAADEIVLRRGFDGINRLWDYRGIQVDDEAQAGEWPRYIEYDRFEYETPPDGIPPKVKQAQMELAHVIQGGVDPFATVTGVVASTRAKAGPVETETTYQGGKSTPRLVAIEGLLRPYLAVGYGQARAVRG